MLSFIPYLKILIRITAIAGVVITLFNLKGCFLDEGRMAIYNQIQNESSDYKVSISMPAVKDFLKEFYFSKKIPVEIQSLEIEGLVLKWVAIGSGPPMSGTVHVKYTNGKRSTSLCRLDELKQWSTETPFYAWLGFWLLAISVTSEVVIDTFEFIERRRKS